MQNSIVSCDDPKPSLTTMIFRKHILWRYRKKKYPNTGVHKQYYPNFYNIDSIDNIFIESVKRENSHNKNQKLRCQLLKSNT